MNKIKFLIGIVTASLAMVATTQAQYSVERPAELKNVESDFNGFYDRYRQHADEGNVHDLLMLGYMFSIIPGHENVSAARGFFQKAADKNNAEAECNLGDINRTPFNMPWAFKLYKKSADQGYAPAELRLGLAYYKGEGAATDLNEAIKWLQKAADQGNKEANKQLGIINAEIAAKARADAQAQEQAQIKAAAQAKINAAQAVVDAKTRTKAEMVGKIEFWSVGCLVIVMAWFTLRKLQKPLANSKGRSIGWADASGIILLTIFFIFGSTLHTAIKDAKKNSGDDVSHSSSPVSQSESAESFVKRAVENGAGVAGTASVVCGEKGGDFAGKFTWRDAAQYQTFHGKVRGSAGNWRMDEFQMGNPISNLH